MSDGGGSGAPKKVSSDIETFPNRSVVGAPPPSSRLWEFDSEVLKVINIEGRSNERSFLSGLNGGCLCHRSGQIRLRIVLERQIILDESIFGGFYDGESQ